jgi:phosphoserine aminotransferase
MTIYNFSPGPSAIPMEIKETMQNAWFDWQGLGLSVAEISHRSHYFVDLLEETKQNLRELLTIPDRYRILFFQGGAQAQFAFIPMNLLKKQQSADYLLYGLWSQRAFDEAKMFADVKGVTIGTDSPPLSIVPEKDWVLNKEAMYLHYCSNETVSGMRLPFVPATNLPLIADMSSDILSQPIDVSSYGLLYACTQKNMGIAGLSVVIVRDDLIDQAQPGLPSIFDFKKQDEFNSLYNTTNTFTMYVLNEVLKWTKKQGGLSAMQERNQAQAKALYDFIDESAFYTNSIDPAYRSLMNVTFQLPSREQEADFVAKAEKQGLMFLKGHRLHGGIRASIYNAMPDAGVDALLDFMRAFIA